MPYLRACHVQVSFVNTRYVNTTYEKIINTQVNVFFHYKDFETINKGKRGLKTKAKPYLELLGDFHSITSINFNLNRPFGDFNSPFV